MSTEYAIEIFRDGWVQPETQTTDEGGMWATEIIAAAWLERKFRVTRDALLKSSGRLIDREDFLKHSKSILAVGAATELELVLHNLMNPEDRWDLSPVQLQQAPTSGAAVPRKLRI